MTISFEEDGSFLNIAFQDYGATIPVTVLNKLPHLSPFNSSEILKMTVNGENVIEVHRGKGLPSIIREVADRSIYSLTIFSGEGCIRAVKGAELIHEQSRPKLEGTRVILSVSKPNFDADAKISSVSVIDSIGAYPSGRYRCEGKGSAEEFREDHLIPALNRSDLVTVELDGVMGYGSSFLEEAFGGLVRKGAFDSEEVLRRVNLVSEEQYLIDETHSYIKTAKQEDKKG